MPCSHRGNGCRGKYTQVWMGPKAMLPPEYENVQCSCGQPGASSSAGGQRGASSSSRVQRGASSSTSGKGAEIAKALQGMGFPEADALRAASGCGSVDEALDRLTRGDGFASAPASAPPAAAVAAGARGRAPEDMADSSMASEDSFSSARSTSARDSDIVGALQQMGFSEADARRAAAGCGSVPEALDKLYSGEVSTSNAPAAVPAPTAPSTAGGAGDPTPDEVAECSICCEELSLAAAAMRCAGTGGMPHYFHAHCLTAWVRQCRTASQNPTCPECRGPVQVRPRRLEEFLQRKGGSLDAEDRQAFQTFREGATDNESDNGWSNVRDDLFTAASVVAAGALIGVAIAGGVALLANRNSGRSRKRG